MVGRRTITVPTDWLREPGDWRAVQRKMVNAGLIRTGIVTRCEVRHDDGCPKLDGGACSCVAEILCRARE